MLRRVLPAILLALLWGVMMGLSALVSLRLSGWQDAGAVRSVISLYALGGLAAFFPAQLAAGLAVRRRHAVELRLAASFLALAASTVAVTAALYALVYRSYYAEWHEPALTYVWLIEFAFTTAAALYQFAVVGLRHYLPLGLLALFAFAWWNATRSR